MEDTDALIVGQGLAGSVLAWSFWEEGRDFRIVDRDEGAYCSQVAGGLIDPISPRLPTKAWLAELHFPEAERFYRRIESLTNTTFYHPRPVHRPYKDAEEKERWEKHAKKKGFDRFLWPKSPRKIPGVKMDPDLGSACFQGAFLDLPTFLAESSRTFSQKGLLQRSPFDPDRLIEHTDGWEWNGLRSRTLILCQGTGIRECPFFKELPLRPNKGEILSIDMPDFPQAAILNRGFYAIPLGEGQVRIGATYDHEDLSPEPTSAKKEELLQRMEDWIRLPYRVLDHKAGFRPTTPDTRPYVGFHRKRKGVAIFNGLGSKGIGLAPYWAQRLREKLREGKEEAPDPRVAPDRFEKKKTASKARSHF
ncbi:MAG: NAD(P)/FAD-dependent oxidoreductase [Flavobacteriales bacterium]